MAATKSSHIENPAELVQMSGPSRWFAAGLSALLPGLGHLYIRRYRRAAAWLSPLVAVVVVAAFTVDRSIAGLAGSVVEPSVLWGLFWLNAAAGVWRLSAAADAFAIASGTSGQSGGEALTLAVGWAALALAVVVPHVLVGSYTVDAVKLVDTLLVSDQAGPPVVPIIPIGTDADVVPDPATAKEASREPYAAVFDEDMWDPDWVTERIRIAGNRAPAVVAPFLSFNERVGERQITILIAGGDAGPGRGGVRTDSMIVATLNTGTGKAALFSFPRNLGSVPMPKRFENAFVEMEKRLGPPPEPLAEGEVAPEWESCKCFPDQLNAIYPFTRKWIRTYPNEIDPGMAALRDVLSGLMGVRIDYYMLVDMAAFVDLVDAVGGIDVYVRQPLKSEVSPPREGDPWATVDVDVGWNHLSGSEALAYSRARKGSSDYARMERQRCMLRGIAAKANPITLLRSFPAIVNALSDSVVTNIPRSFVSDFMTLAGSLDFSDIETVGFTHAYWLDERDYLRHPVPDVDKIKSKVRRVLRGQDESAVVDTANSECN